MGLSSNPRSEVTEFVLRRASRGHRTVSKTLGFRSYSDTVINAISEQLKILASGKIWKTRVTSK